MVGKNGRVAYIRRPSLDSKVLFKYKEKKEIKPNLQRKTGSQASSCFLEKGDPFRTALVCVPTLHLNIDSLNSE